MRDVLRFGAVVALASVALVGSSVPTRAECVSQPNRFPDFADVAPTARTVVIGTVIETRPDPDESSGLFTLRVDQVLRGDPPSTMEVEVLRSGLPRQGAPSCRNDAFLHAMTGDVIALAVDGRLGPRSHINTAAWVRGRPDEWDPGIRILSRKQVIAAAEAMPPTDSIADPDAGLGWDAAHLVSVIVSALAEAWEGVVAFEVPR